jgi:putative ABC transport system substrate-binding protein
MKRREFIALIGGAVAIWPDVANAQKLKMLAIGYIESGSSSTSSPNIPATFRAGLKETGFVEGQNVTIEYRAAEAQYDRLPALVADLVSRKVDVIVASGAVVSPLAAQGATKTIPIVFMIGADPVRTGLVASLNQPGGNITGVTVFGGELGRKRVALLRELIPSARTVGLLINPKNPTHLFDEVSGRGFADTVGVPLETVSASTESDFEPAIASLAEKRVDAVYVIPDTLFGSKRDRLVAVLTQFKLPAIFYDSESAVAGGLISYGGSITDAQRQAGIYAGRILKGEKPVDLPVLQPTKFDLVINLKTAKAFGLSVPNSLLVQATEVIE